MANDNNDISDIVKKCKILLLDIEGTTTSISFVKDKLFPYAEENVKDFLNEQWETDDVKEVVTALRKLALEDKENSVEGVVAIPGEDASKEEQIEGLVNSVKWQMASDRKVGALKQLQGLIWKQGYDKGDIKGHVYDDVSPALELWRSAEGQKVYIYSSGSVQAQKLLFGQSSAGDLLKYIDGHFDTAVGAKQEAASYATIAEKIGCKPEEILFLTDIVKEAEAARASGVQAALVSREGNAPLPSDASSTYPVLYSLAQLANTNKRKPDDQVEQPAKVPKTDVDADVKTAAEVAETQVEPETEAPKADDAAVPATVPEISAENTTKPAEEPEKMEVEEVANGTTAETKPEEAVEKKEDVEMVEKVETIVEEITDSNEIADTPVCDIEPIIEESSDKTENPETEKMETDTEPVAEPKEDVEIKNGENGAPVPEETPPAVITEIKDVTNDKESLKEVEEIIEDLEPVIEEPPATAPDIEELQNVGEVLEKECDEILSKVQDVTNLDNIPVKPLLNTIAEETMETDNMDSNDIVERILDTEMEMEMKQNAEKEQSAAQITEPKAENENKNETAETAVDNSTKVTQEDTPAEKAGETDEKMKEKIEECNTEAKAKSTELVDEIKTTTEENKIENKMETEVSSTPVTEESPKEVAEVKDTPAEIKTDENPQPEEKVEAVKELEKKEAPTEQSKIETETPIDAKDNENVTEEAKPDSEPTEQKETHLNGKATNGDAEIVNLNGDANKEDELSSRLSMENGKEVVNGANGDTAAEKEKTESSAEVDVADIKVKTVAVDEPRNDPIEQPTEA